MAGLRLPMSMDYHVVALWKWDHLDPGRFDEYLVLRNNGTVGFRRHSSRARAAVGISFGLQP